jgi:hypothetical protein
MNRPSHNGTYVYFHDATLNGTVVLQYDCGWSPNVIYSGSTMIIYAPFSWVPGHTYYITFDSGLNFYIEVLLDSMHFFSLRSSKWE